MNPKNRRYLEELERKYVPVLFDHCRSLFEGHHLPSHDHLHHLRVWYYTKELLLEEPHICEHLSNKNILLLMLAIFFHDTGLTKTLNENHGIESRILCHGFIAKNPGMFPFEVDEALKAIEYHDKKESEISTGSKSKINILKLLSICDDIDAYGAIGILRYAEIYLLRGISFAGLPDRVIKNISFRFKQISSQDWIPGLFLAKHKSRYQYAKKFYQKMGKHLLLKTDNQNCGKIIKSYMNYVYHGKKGIMDFAYSLKDNDNLSTKEFASCLKDDLKQDYINELNLTNGLSDLQ